ncbi:DNA cytosine methyltransferase [Effusibacillus consociatus]|uniref:DNA (cytosine-5-)-methyltransferase n=1 Tax=Effusibacillus consociatus TaxID=1117041 RepID=A0ABV9Q3S8_9BACL
MKFKALHLFCGIGGGSLGFKQAKQEYRGIVGEIENVLGIDADPDVCRNYETITGSPAACMDLFSREQYIDFHGIEPPADWREVEPYDIWRACNGVAPDVVFTSPPCKGFSGLLPEKSAKTKKYQALNKLTVRGIKLCLDAFEHDLPALFLLENVTRITTRGAELLDEIKSLLKSYGYAVHEGSHDCGEIGGLAQHRKRYLLIARNERKVMPFVYKPPKKRVRTIGEVLGPLPLPDDPAGGPMHRLPRLQWKTWVRLALIPAEGDWRDLEKVEWQKYRITHVPRVGALGVADWNQPSGAVTGSARFGGSNGVAAVSDPRLTLESMYPSGYGVQGWDQPSQTIRSAGRIMNAPVSIADPRTGFKEGTHGAIYRVSKWEESANTVTGAHRPNNGAPCINDPRVGENGPKFNHAFKITNWNEVSGTVASGTGPSSGGLCVADPRLDCRPRSGSYGVQSWDEPAKTVIGAGDIHAGATAVADPRIPQDTENGVWVIIAEDGTWHRPLTTYELAMLQGFPTHLSDGRPFQLEGGSDAKCREWIGNAVPPAAARAIAETILTTLMANLLGDWLMSAEEIWVMPEDDHSESEVVYQ